MNAKAAIPVKRIEEPTAEYLQSEALPRERRDYDESAVKDASPEAGRQVLVTFPLNRRSLHLRLRYAVSFRNGVPSSRCKLLSTVSGLVSLIGVVNYLTTQIAVAHLI